MTTSGFNALFPGLRAWQPPGATDAERLEALYRLSQASFGRTESENQAIPAGYTYFGQLVTHDLTFDARPSFGAPLATVPNLRSAALDLDCVYGRGREDQPYLYSLSNPAKFLVGRNGNWEHDLPRNPDDALNDGSTCEFLKRQRIALAGDPRNDENILLSQLHLQVLRFHNRWIDEGRSFEEARRLTCWHYQWLVVHDFLKRLCGVEFVDRILGHNGHPNLRHFRLEEPLVPLEFAAAAFRLGHSMVRPAYRLSDALSSLRGHPITILNPLDSTNSLEGNRELPANWSIQWDYFVDTGLEQRPQVSMRIDRNIAAPLLSALPSRDDTRLRSLATRTLLRGWRAGLPSGQAIAASAGITPLDGADEPLWLYLLKEAEMQCDGRYLGTLGATIVAEVVVGLLAADRNSFFTQRPNWRPDLENQGRFQLVDFLRFAGAPLSRSDWYVERRRADEARKRSLERQNFLKPSQRPAPELPSR